MQCVKSLRVLEFILASFVFSSAFADVNLDPPPPLPSIDLEPDPVVPSVPEEEEVAPQIPANTLDNATELRKELSLNQFKSPSQIAEKKNLRVAVLDVGFAGFDPGFGWLPSSTEIVQKPRSKKVTQALAQARAKSLRARTLKDKKILKEDPDVEMAEEDHGLQMAMIAWGVSHFSKNGPKFFLVNINGHANFKGAIEWILDNDIDIVLSSQNFVFGGNLDGQGFINAQVSRVIKKGIFWVNSAGNNGQLVYNGPVQSAGKGKKIKLPNTLDTLKFSNTVDSNLVRLTLLWNDYTDSDEDSTSKDLNFRVLNSSGSVVAQAKKIQNGQPYSPGNEKKVSIYPREYVEVLLNRGDYSIEITDASGNFIASKDRLSMSVNSPQFLNSIVFEDASGSKEVFPPADHPDVFAVGDMSDVTALGPTAAGDDKPDLSMPTSQVAFSVGSSSSGSSNAAAIFAGVLIEMKAYAPEMRPQDLRRYLKSLEPERRGVGPIWKTPSDLELIDLVGKP